MKILKLDEGGANEESCFVWYGAVFADEIGTAGQAYHAMNEILSKNDKIANKPTGQEPANIRHIGTALGTMTHHDGKPTTVRIIVVTAEIKK